MARYRKSPISKWREQGFQRLSDEAKLLYWYLRGCSHNHLSGLQYFLPVIIQSELGWSADKTERVLGQLHDSQEIQWDPIRSVVWVVGMLADEGRGSNIIKAAVDQVASMPSSPVVDAFIGGYPSVLEAWKLTDQFSYQKVYPFEGDTEPLRRGPYPDPDPSPGSVQQGVLKALVPLKPKKTTRPSITHALCEEIRVAWYDICVPAGLPGFELTADVASKLKERMLTVKSLRTVKAWRDFLQGITELDHYMGKSGTGDWKISIRWMIASDAKLDEVYQRVISRGTNRKTEGPPPGYTD